MPRQGPRSPQQRFEEAVLSTGVLPYTAAHFERLTVEPWMIDHLAKAETTVRDLRHQLEAHLTKSPRRCARCGDPIGGRSDRRFCSDRCRIAAHLETKRQSATDTAV